MTAAWAYMPRGYRAQQRSNGFLQHFHWEESCPSCVSISLQSSWHCPKVNSLFMFFDSLDEVPAVFSMLKTEILTLTLTSFLFYQVIYLLPISPGFTPFFLIFALTFLVWIFITFLVFSFTSIFLNIDKFISLGKITPPNSPVIWTLHRERCV